MKKQILMSILVVGVTSMLMGTGTYAYLATPKIHIDNTSPTETTHRLVHPDSNNPSDNQLFNDTRMQYSAL